MSQFIDQNIGNLNCGNISSPGLHYVTGPIKKVESPEQFVPLFTCTPRVMGGVYPSGRIKPDHFPELEAYLKQFSAILNITILSVLQRWCGDYFSSVSYSSWGSVNTTAWSNITKSTQIALERGALLTNLESSIAITLRSVIRYNGIENQYGLFHSKNAALGSSNSEVIIHNVGGYIPPTIIKFAGQTYMSRWLYLGMLQEQKTKIPKIPGLEFVDNLPILKHANLSNGIETCFCLVVKEKYKEEITLNLFTKGHFNDVEIKKGDLQLWEEKGIEKKLPLELYKKYQKGLQSAIRNDLKCPVKQFTALTEQLFDIEKPVIETDEQFEKEAITRIQNARKAFEITQGKVAMKISPSYTYANL